MKIVHSKRPLPWDWTSLPHGDGLVLQQDIRPTEHSRLRLKLLVFESKSAMRKFWRRNIQNESLGLRCLAAVNRLVQMYYHDKACQNLALYEVDPRYFAVMALVKSRINAEIITHESVHAGFAYAARVDLRKRWSAIRHTIEEEAICYPTGRITSAITNALYCSGITIPNHP